MQELIAAVDFPLTENIERLAIQHENAAWPVAIGISERANVNRFRTAVNRVRTRIVGARENFLRLDNFDYLWFPRIGLHIDDVNTRRANTGHHQVTPFYMRMR